MLGHDDQARIGRGIDLPQPFGQMADGGLRVVGEPEQEAARDHRLAAQVRIVAPAAERHHPVEQQEGLPEALLIAAQRGLEQEHLRLLHRIAGAALEQPLGAGEALLGRAEIRADALRVAEARPGARAEVVDPRLAVEPRRRGARAASTPSRDSSSARPGSWNPHSRAVSSSRSQNAQVWMPRGVGHALPLAFERLRQQLAQQLGSLRPLGRQGDLPPLDLAPGTLEGRAILERRHVARRIVHASVLLAPGEPTLGRRRSREVTRRQSSQSVRRWRTISRFRRRCSRPRPKRASSVGCGCSSIHPEAPPAAPDRTRPPGAAG